MLTHKRSDHFKVIDYSDLNFLGCLDSRKPTFMYVFLLIVGALSWNIEKQTIIASSTMEKKFVAYLCDHSSIVFFSKNDMI